MSLLHRLRRALRCERGTVLATTTILMGLMTMTGLATYAYVDTQTAEGGRERVRETSFNVGEGLLGSQVFILSRGWPGKSTDAFPTSCAGGSTHAKCPDGATLVQSFGGPDVAKGVTWQTRVLDNKLDTPRLPTTTDATDRCKLASAALPSYYDDAAMLQGPVTYDQNGDCRMWVRAQAQIDGRKRTFVGLVRVDLATEQFPRNVVTAGKVGTGNNGNKVLIDTQGDAAQPSKVAVRCPQAAGKACVDIGKDIQINPPSYQFDYPNATAMSPEAVDRLRERAQSLGTYYNSASGCPSLLAGSLVFIENGDIRCTGNSEINSATTPGMLVIATGTAYFGNEFYGIIHMLNLQNSSDWVLETGGNALIQGAVAVDGPGGVMISASKLNLVFDDGVFSRVVSYGNAGIIQNTWREIVPAS